MPGLESYDPDTEYDVILGQVTPFADYFLPASREIRVSGEAATQLGDAIVEAREANTPNLTTAPIDNPDAATE